MIPFSMAPSTEDSQARTRSCRLTVSELTLRRISMLSGFYRTLPGKFCSDVWGRCYQVRGAGFGVVDSPQGPLSPSRGHCLLQLSWECCTQPAPGR